MIELLLGNGQGQKWTFRQLTVPAAVEARYGHKLVGHNDLLYTLGGYPVGSKSWNWNTNTATWVEQPVMINRQGFEVLNYGGWAMLFGGVGTDATNYPFERVQMSSINRHNLGLPAGALRTQAALGGGASAGKVNVLGGLIGGEPSTRHDYFQWTTSTWHSGAPLPIPLRGHTALSVVSFIYLMGGLTTNGAINYNLYRYDQTNNTWSYLNTAPTNVFGLPAVAYKNYLVFVGLSTPNHVLYVYDTTTNAWLPPIPTTIPLRNTNMAISVVRNSIYLFGGTSPQGVPLKELWKIDLLD